MKVSKILEAGKTMTEIPLIKKHKIDDAYMTYLHYPSDGPDLVLLHATGFFSWLWHPIASRLCGRFNIIAPDFYGYRKKDPHEGGLGWDILAGDIFKLCKSHNMRKPFIAGHSMGGAVAVLCAALHDILPERLLLIEPIFLPEIAYIKRITVQQHPLASKAIKRKNSWKNLEEARTYLKTRKLFETWNEEMIELYLEHGFTESEDGGLSLTCPPDDEASLFMGSTALNPWPLLQKINCPVLVLEGEKTENRSFVDIKKALSLFKHSRYLEIKNVGHLIPMEQPETIYSIMNDFFS
jgi:pimeloyl-ACP methyl ester carboxylesterase